MFPQYLSIHASLIQLCWVQTRPTQVKVSTAMVDVHCWPTTNRKIQSRRSSACTALRIIIIIMSCALLDETEKKHSSEICTRCVIVWPQKNQTNHHYICYRRNINWCRSEQQASTRASNDLKRLEAARRLIDNDGRSGNICRVCVYTILLHNANILLLWSTIKIPHSNIRKRNRTTQVHNNDGVVVILRIGVRRLIVFQLYYRVSKTRK